MNNKSAGLSAISLTMMALGTVIGGSFFLGSAIGIRSAGPGILIPYIIVGIIVYFILFSLSEMTVADPTPGSFRTYAQRGFGPGAGFVVGWVYWTGLVLAMSSEAAAVSIFLRVWFPNISVPVLGGSIIIAVTLLNLLGAEHLSRLESAMSAVKLFAIVGFIVLAIALITGMVPNVPSIGLGMIQGEAFFPAGIKGVLGSMLIVMFTYAGFEIIGLAASEAKDPHRTIPKAITYTVISLIGLYIASIGLLLPLIPTKILSPESSPFVTALERNTIHWAAGGINIILVTAILSTMLAAAFGLGRMIRSLAEEGYAPKFLRDAKEVPYRGIVFSGLAMLLGMSLGFFLPKRVYLFLVSSGGFSLLFTYLVILLSHHKFRQKHGCPGKGKCQVPGYPYTSWMSIIAVLIIIVTMPLIPGQGAGLLAGLLLIGFYVLCYLAAKHMGKIRRKIWSK